MEERRRISLERNTGSEMKTEQRKHIIKTLIKM